MNELNPEEMAKELWSQVHEEIEDCEENFDDDGNCRYSEERFSQMFQGLKDILEGKSKAIPWEEAWAKIQAEVEEELAAEELEKSNDRKVNTAV